MLSGGAEALELGVVMSMMAATSSGSEKRASGGGGGFAWVSATFGSPTALAGDGGGEACRGGGVGGASRRHCASLDRIRV